MHGDNHQNDTCNPCPDISFRPGRCSCYVHI
jgi:hypothetical protein